MSDRKCIIRGRRCSRGMAVLEYNLRRVKNCQRLVKGRDEAIIYPWGVEMKSRRAVQSRHTSGKRGRITTFSIASCRRLKNWFGKRDVKGSVKIGACFTIPFTEDCKNDLKWFKYLLNLFTQYFRNSGKTDIGVVYRCELQKKGRPHIHAVVYVPSKYDVENIKCLLHDFWVSSVLTTSKKYGYDIPQLGAFVEKYGVRFDKLVCDSIGYFRYLTDHTSKHKREQLGYIGKQWGVVNRKSFSVVPAGASLPFDDEDHRKRFVRAVARVNRYPVTIGKGDDRRVVKYRRVRGRWSGICFMRGGDDTARKLFENARGGGGNYATVGKVSGV